MFTFYKKVKSYYDGLTDIGKLGFGMFVGTGFPVLLTIMTVVLISSIEKLIN